ERERCSARHEGAKRLRAKLTENQDRARATCCEMSNDAQRSVRIEDDEVGLERIERRGEDGLLEWLRQRPARTIRICMRLAEPRWQPHEVELRFLEERRVAGVRHDEEASAGN